MPYSSDEGKNFIKWFFTLDKRVAFVLDVGPGAGVYYDLLNPVLAPDFWCAVEIWAPYIEKFKLCQRYDEVIVSDIRYLDWNQMGPFDLVILGDVLEHMGESDATKVVDRAIGHSKYVVISIPIVDYPQGAEFGNPYETHVTSWTNESVLHFLKGYDILDSYRGEVVGVYILKGAQLF